MRGSRGPRDGHSVYSTQTGFRFSFKFISLSPKKLPSFENPWEFIRSSTIRKARGREATNSALAGPGRSPGKFWGFKINCKQKNEKFEWIFL